MPKNKLQNRSLATPSDSKVASSLPTIKKIDFTTAVINLTYRCNDNCVFCFNKKFLHKSPELSLIEVKQKFADVCRRWRVREVILTGGEPTLHPQFWEVMDFFLNCTRVIISLNTNGLIFNDLKFCKRLKSLIQSARNPRSMFSLSLSNIDHFPPHTTREKLKLRGIKNAIKIAQDDCERIVVVIAVTKTNYQALPGLVSTVAKMAKKDKEITIFLRGLYLAGSMDSKQKSMTIPHSFETIEPFLINSLEAATRNSNVKIRLFNLPFCYFKNWKNLPKAIDQQKPWWHEQRINIKKGAKSSARFFKEENWTRPECMTCALEPICGKIQTEYLEKYNYPPLKPF